MTERVELKPVKIKKTKLKDNGIEYKIDDEISLDKAETILNDIKENVIYNSQVVDKFLLLKPRYVRDVLDLCTNIDFEKLTPNELYNDELEELLQEMIRNYDKVYEIMVKEYDKYILENCFLKLGGSMPSGEEMEKSMNAISDAIKDLPEDKLEMIAKSIVWNNSPALGSVMYPAEHKE